MSWSAHDFEPYVLQRHLKGRVTLLPLYLGSIAPDIATKWYVYGLKVGFLGIHLRADDPATFHRGWPGAGFTHAPLFGALVGLIIFAASRNRLWAFSFALGMVSHALTDSLDTNGTMLLFPFSTHRVSFGMWAFAADEGHFVDGRAFYSSLGGVTDAFWGVLAIASWKVLRQSYFEEQILPTDPVWRRIDRVLPRSALLVLYRAGFVFGNSRMVAWVIYAHVLHTSPFDLSWGGPFWVTPIK